MHFICILPSIGGFLRSNDAARPNSFLYGIHIFFVCECRPSSPLSCSPVFSNFFVKPQIQSNYQQYTIFCIQKKKTIKKGAHLRTMSLFFESERKKKSSNRSKTSNNATQPATNWEKERNIKMYGIQIWWLLVALWWHNAMISLNFHDYIYHAIGVFFFSFGQAAALFSLILLSFFCCSLNGIFIIYVRIHIKPYWIVISNFVN